jgi:hypothetical protein
MILPLLVFPAFLIGLYKALRTKQKHVLHFLSPIAMDRIPTIKLHIMNQVLSPCATGGRGNLLFKHRLT